MATYSGKVSVVLRGSQHEVMGLNTADAKSDE